MPTSIYSGGATGLRGNHGKGLFEWWRKGEGVPHDQKPLDLISLGKFFVRKKLDLKKTEP